MIIYFIRHAEPDYSEKNNNLRGLTGIGEEQAKKLVISFQDISITAIYSSPYLRAIQTLEPISENRKLPIITIDEFRERESAARIIPQQDFIGFGLKQWTDHGFHFAGGESIEMTAQRYLSGINKVIQKHRDEDILLIGCHITGLCAFLSIYNIINNYTDFQKVSSRKPWIVKCVYHKNDLKEVFSIDPHEGNVETLFLIID